MVNPTTFQSLPNVIHIIVGSYLSTTEIEPMIFFGQGFESDVLWKEKMNEYPLKKGGLDHPKNELLQYFRRVNRQAIALLRLHYKFEYTEEKNPIALYKKLVTFVKQETPLIKRQLIFSSANGMIGMVRLYLDTERKPYQIPSQALRYACENHEIDCAKLLFNYGCTLNKKDEHHCMLIACRKGYRKVVKMLLGSEFKNDESGNIYLNWACFRGDSEIVKMVLARFDISEQIMSKCLLKSHENANQKVVKELIIAGATHK